MRRGISRQRECVSAVKGIQSVKESAELGRRVPGLKSARWRTLHFRNVNKEREVLSLSGLYYICVIFAEKDCRRFYG